MMGTVIEKKEFDQIFNSDSTGKLKFAEMGIGWKDATNGNIITIQSSDMLSCSWFRAARSYAISIKKKDESSVSFDGFSRDYLVQLQSIFLSFYNIHIALKEMAIKGWNWGSTEFTGSNLEFLVDSKSAFQVPLNQIASTALPAKNEVSLEFAASTDPARKRHDALVEIRLYVPGTQSQSNDDDLLDEDEVGLKPDKEPISNATYLHDAIRQRGDIETSIGEAIVTFKDVLCIVPRGRFEVEMHSLFFRLRGKSHDYKILFTSISKMILVPKINDQFYTFVIGLEPPLRQGQTRYPFILFQFQKEDDTECEIKLSEKDQELFKGKLESSYDAPSYQVISQIFKALSSKKILSSSFKSAENQSGVKCSLKANECVLYPLEKNFLAIPKPTLLIPHNDINRIVFSRVGNTRTFEAKLITQETEYAFSNIPREEYNFLLEYCSSKKIMVDTEENEAVAYQDPLSDDSDEEPRKRILDFNGEDEGSSVDEDFVEPKSDAEPENSGSGSDEGSDAEAEKSGNDSDKQVDVDDDDDIEITVKKAEKPKEKSKDKKEKKAVIKSGIEKPKQKKDPNAPKKNLSSYIFFSNEQRLILTKKDPKLPFADVAKLLGSMWKEMTADDKKKYDDMAAKDKIRYADEMKTYVPSAASQSDQKSKPLKKQKIESSSKSADVSKSVVKSAEFIEDSDVEML